MWWSLLSKTIILHGESFTKKDESGSYTAIVGLVLVPTVTWGGWQVDTRHHISSVSGMVERMSNGAKFSPYLHYSVPRNTGSPGNITGLPYLQAPPLWQSIPKHGSNTSSPGNIPGLPSPIAPLWQSIPVRRSNTGSPGIILELPSSPALLCRLSCGNEKWIYINSVGIVQALYTCTQVTILLLTVIMQLT